MQEKGVEEARMRCLTGHVHASATLVHWPVIKAELETRGNDKGRRQGFPSDLRVAGRVGWRGDGEGGGRSAHREDAKGMPARCSMKSRLLRACLIVAERKRTKMLNHADLVKDSNRRLMAR
jgi:hypothetical protein